MPGRNDISTGTCRQIAEDAGFNVNKLAHGLMLALRDGTGNQEPKCLNSPDCAVTERIVRALHFFCLGAGNLCTGLGSATRVVAAGLGMSRVG